MCLSFLRSRWICLGLLQFLAEWEVEKLRLVKKMKRVKKVRNLLVVLENIYRSPGRGTRISLGTVLTACGEEVRKQETNAWSQRGTEGSPDWFGGSSWACPRYSPAETSRSNRLTPAVGLEDCQSGESAGFRSKPR